MEAFEGLFERESLLLTFAVLLKMGIAVILAGAIGWERERHGRPAGIRTHMLMVVGVVLISEVSKVFVEDGDPTRIASGIVAGIGFIGAGAIMRMGLEVKGLTTAASVWATASIGMAISAGGPMILIAVFATILALITLEGVDRFERRVFPDLQPPEVLIRLSQASSLDQLLKKLRDHGVDVREARVVGDGGGWEAVLRVKTRSADVIRAALECPGILSAEWIT